MKYYYANAANQPVGPFELAEVTQLAEAGTISEQTHVIAEGSQTWVTYGQLLRSTSFPPPPGAALVAVPALPAKGISTATKIGFVAVVVVIATVVTVAVLNMTGSTGALDRGLIAYYPFDGDAHDASGNGRDAQLINSPTFVPGVQGSAVYLTGGGRFGDGGPHVQLPFILLSNYPEFTISLWTKVDNVIEEAEAVIAFGSSPGGQIAIGVKPDDQSVYWEYGPSENMHEIWRDPNPSARSWIGGWKHLVFVYDRGTLSGYVNGRRVVTETVNQPLLEGQTAGIGIHWFPGYPWGVSTRFVGAVDEVRIYNRALAPNEVQELARVVAGRAL